MIPTNRKIYQDYLSPKLCKKLVEAGVDMKLDSYWCWVVGKETIFLSNKDAILALTFEDVEIIPTYSFAELFYKLPEWLYYKNEKGEVIADAPLSFLKDAPFYMFFYKGRGTIDGERRDLPGNQDPFVESQHCSREYPIESLAALLLWCIEHKYGYVKNVSDK